MANKETEVWNVERRHIVAAAALITAAGSLAAVAALPKPAAAMGIVRCAKHGYAGTAMVDPIGDRGAPTSMHSHDFYGSTTLLHLPHPELATAAQLMGGGTTCTIKPDTAAYWQPTLFRGTGSSMVRVSIKRMEAYYLCWDGRVTCPNPASAVRPFPTDLRLVAGNPVAKQAGDMNPNVYWHCGLFSTKPGTKYHFPTPAAADCATARPVPGHPSGVALAASITFPSCWDGRMNDHTRMGNTADYSGTPGAVTNHLAYPVHPGGAGASCPAAFPIRLPRLRENMQWNYTGDGRDVHLASDMTPGAPAGVTLHADFLQSWSPSALVKMVDICIDTPASEKAVHQPPLSDVCGGPIPN